LTVRRKDFVDFQAIDFSTANAAVVRGPRSITPLRSG
jgi:hypothetical protein